MIHYLKLLLSLPHLLLEIYNLGKNFFKLFFLKKKTFAFYFLTYEVSFMNFHALENYNLSLFGVLVSLFGVLVSIVAQTVKNLPAMQETQVQSLGQEDPLEKDIATHSSILAWRIPWTKEPGRLQSMGSQTQTQVSD